MNFCRAAFWRFIVVLSLLTIFPSHAAEKKIRLRAETIVTTKSEPERTRTTQRLEPKANGLHLLQLTGPLRDAERKRLEEEGIELLRYIPDDTFIVRFKERDLGQLRSLAFVQWVGPYRPDHKLHPKFKELASRPGPLTTTSIRVLLAPRTSPSEANGVRRLFHKLERQSTMRLGTILEGEVSTDQLQQLALSPTTLWIEPAGKMKLFDEIAAKIVGGDDGLAGTPTLTQQLGFDGSGVTVSVADSGLHNGDTASMHPDLAGRVDGFFFYGSLTNAADEHSHGTHVAGIVAGNAELGEIDGEGFLYGLGVAPGAHIVAQRIFDGEGEYHPPPSMETLTRDAVRSGAVIGSNSWGDDTQGSYDLAAAEFDALVRDADAATPLDQPYILEFSAGNAGPLAQTIGSPAVAKNVIATGASQNNRFDFFIYSDGQEVMADFSSRGPCEDGRIKPDVVAPGTWIASLQSASATDETSWSPISPNYQYQGGTSQSGPQVSGAAAVFVQYYRELHTNTTPSPALVKAALINSAVDMDNSFDTGPVPNNDEGWGRVDLTRLIGSELSFEMMDQNVLLSAGGLHERRIVVASSDHPLKITLTYTDFPGLPAAVPALVNDLDLEVEDPDGNIYKGNQFVAGESVPNPAASDHLNNVEGVLLTAPLPGEYIVRIRAMNVVEDARVDTGSIDQDFALVASADLAPPDVAVVVMNRNYYTAPDRIGLKLYDFDQAGSPSATLTIRSTLEAAGETVVLQASGSRGVFTGSVFTAQAAVQPDTTLQVNHGDLIEAIYLDLSANTSRLAIAHADLLPPVITNVGSSNAFGKVVIGWETDELSTGMVMYGTNSLLTFSATNSGFSVTPAVTLAGLQPGVIYQYLVVAIDRAGNRSTNNNTNGTLFTFTPASIPPVLLVDDNFGDPLLDIPLSTYTEPLDQIGVGYQIWDVAQLGRSPTANDLQPFRAVIWRVGEFINAPLSLSEQDALRNYVTNGGALFMASMEILSRLDESGGTSFRRNILQVDSYGVDVAYEAVLGGDNDSVSDQMDLSLDFTAYNEFQNLNGSDTITPSASAIPVFTEPLSGEIAGLRYPAVGSDLRGRVVFLPFPFDTVPMSGADPNNRVELLRRILNFLIPGLSGNSEIALDKQTHTVPSLVTVEVTDPDRSGLGPVPITYFREGETNTYTLFAQETVSQGIFRGFLALVPTNSIINSNELRVSNGDIFHLQYFDDSSGSLATTFALVETIPPQITNLVSEPDYTEAIVSWETSEAADALVQFGESRFLGRTATRRGFSQTHELVISGLDPDRVYYFQVTSRDPAGNTAVDDNNGELYTFRTLRPLETPWSDDFERGNTNWQVLDSEVGGTSWEFGQPNNELNTQAHSPTNAWGSNLNGLSIDLGDTTLVTSPIHLTGGNQATLRFWHNYDFTLTDNDIWHYGSVRITTNEWQDSGIEVARFEDETSEGWVEEEIDLSRFVGQVVRVGFYYGLFSFDSATRGGWLVDDVSLETTGVPVGNIFVTNNLSQASFTLSGQVVQNGSGISLLLTNLPVGEYRITYNPVPFFTSPLPQTNLLAAGNTLQFTGIYTFNDTDTNGISDEWETFYFGSNTESSADPDRDGASNWLEFLSGTNPTNAQSTLVLSPPTMGSGLRFEWPASIGYSYRIEESTNLLTWTPSTDWIRATRTTPSVTLPVSTNGVPLYFRLQVKP